MENTLEYAEESSAQSRDKDPSKRVDIEYYLTKEDRLTWYLFRRSKKSGKVRRRVQSHFLFLLFLVFVLFWAHSLERSFNLFLTVGALLLFALHLVLYPLFLRWYYPKHYRRYIDMHYLEEDLSEESPLKFRQENDTFFFATKNKISKLPYTLFESVYEIEEYFLLIRKKKEGALIFPKKRIDDIREFRSSLISLPLTFHSDLDWRWS